jgi:hypothetical protein
MAETKYGFVNFINKSIRIWVYRTKLSQFFEFATLNWQQGGKNFQIFPGTSRNQLSCEIGIFSVSQDS